MYVEEMKPQGQCSSIQSILWGQTSAAQRLTRHRIVEVGDAFKNS